MRGTVRSVCPLEAPGPPRAVLRGADVLYADADEDGVVAGSAADALRYLVAMRRGHSRSRIVDPTLAGRGASS